MTDTVSTLAVKLAAIMSEVEPLAKHGQNDAMRFKFVTVQQMIELLRPLMAKQGLAIIPKVTNIEYTDAGQTSSGKPITACHLLADFTVTDGNEAYTVTTAGEAHDYGDKAANKAFTAAQKQALSKLFMLSADEDNDSEHVERSTPQRQTVQRRAPALRPAPGDEDDPERTPTPAGKLVQLLNARFGNKPTVKTEWVSKHAPEIKGVRPEDVPVETLNRLIALLEAEPI